MTDVTCWEKTDLDHLVRIAVDGPPLNQWDPTDAVQLWWKSLFKRRQVQDTRPAATPSTSRSQEDSTDTYVLNLEDWDTFIA